MVERERNSKYLDFEAACHCCSWWCVERCLWRMLLPAVGGLGGGLMVVTEEEEDFFDEEGRIGLMVVFLMQQHLVEVKRKEGGVQERTVGMGVIVWNGSP